MRHARSDYDAIQDPRGLIPEDEPVFLIRAQDENAVPTLMWWAGRALSHGAPLDIVQAVVRQAEAMRRWQEEHGARTPDAPEGSV